MTELKSMECDPMDCSPPGSCSWNFPDKNVGEGCHPPEDLPDPGIEPRSSALQADP